MNTVATKETTSELSADINVITAEINAYQRVAGEAIFEIGRRLKYVKESKLTEGHGGWTAWLREVGISTSQADRFIKVVTELEGKFPTSGSIGLGTLYEIATLPPEQREAEHVTAKGETKTPSEMTVRELRELKAELKKTQEQRDAERKERERLEIENEELANREPEVVTEYVEKETQEPYDRTLDEPYLVERSRDFYEMLNEIDGLYRKYAHLSNSIEELRDLAYYDDDAKQKYWKADEFWRNLREIFKEGNSNIIDAEII